MRTLLGISIASVIAVTVWWTFPTKAKQQFGTVSIDPVSMMATTTNLPNDPQYDHGFVFLPPEAQYNQ
jgi:hypothetical protein